jgi:2-polyprenyl-3-methyl-5-hydroxy-6-metoxy-1,4-benzoquinol methylase
MELTGTEFWDEYWRKQHNSSGIDRTYSFDRCLSKALEKVLHRNSGASILEVGCAPGRWMSFFGSDLGLYPSGIEYSPIGVEVTKNLLRMLNVKFGTFYTGDFFEIEPKPIYDIVASFGFIEHFDDAIAVCKRHEAWIKPGGMLVLGVPNFNGIYRPIQLLLDSDILRKHNTKIMNKEFFVELQTDIMMRLQRFSFIGSFEPSLPLSFQVGFDPVRWFIQKTLVVLAHIRNPLRIMDSLN